MHLAAGQGHLDIVKYLVEDKAADIYVKDSQGVSMTLHYWGYGSVLVYFLKYLRKGFYQLFDLRVYA